MSPKQPPSSSSPPPPPPPSSSPPPPEADVSPRSRYTLPSIDTPVVTTTKMETTTSWTQYSCIQDGGDMTDEESAWKHPKNNNNNMRGAFDAAASDSALEYSESSGAEDYAPMAAARSSNSSNNNYHRKNKNRVRSRPAAACHGRAQSQPQPRSQSQPQSQPPSFSFDDIKSLLHDNDNDNDDDDDDDDDASSSIPNANLHPHYPHARSHRRVHSTSSFRFRDTSLTKSSRVVRFESSSEDEENVRSSSKPKPEDMGIYGGNTNRRKNNASGSDSSGGKKKSKQKHKQQTFDSTTNDHKTQHHQIIQDPESPRNASFMLDRTRYWVTQLAYSFRTPTPPIIRKRQTSPLAKEHYPSPLGSPDQKLTNDNHRQQAYSEESPLLGLLPPKLPLPAPNVTQPAPKKTNAPIHDSGYFATLAASFLHDYESTRPPILTCGDLDSIPQWKITLYNIKFHSTIYSTILMMACVCLFLSSALEGHSQPKHHILLITLLNIFSFLVLAIDLWIRAQFKKDPKRHSPNVRRSRSKRLREPLYFFGIFMVLETFARFIATTHKTYANNIFPSANLTTNSTIANTSLSDTTTDPNTITIILYSSFFKPIVLFYISYRARDALESLVRIAKTVLRVIIIELVLILSFAAVACRLFRTYDTFKNLSTSWLSLFELATTVVNPSIWMPMYQSSKLAAIFFIFFIVTSVFYLHSLVLSVVFQTYIQAATEIHDRSVSNREDAIHFAYAALKKINPNESGISMADVRKTLQLVRPHYNSLKINALCEIIDPTNQKHIDFPTFRAKIRQALNASIRTARMASAWAMTTELIAVAVAVFNFVYVILLTSTFENKWFDAYEVTVGCVITIVGLLELMARFNPLRIPDFTPVTRLNGTFDGIALAAALVSSFGVALFIAGRPLALEFILMGRAVDMIRVMRFFQIFRDVVRRSADVLPALAGPVILIFTMIHIFVYLGMGLWGGAVEVGILTANEISPLYDLNNFNSYIEGMVTMFQVLVVNDWHAIATVFLYATRCSSPCIVYPFFIIGNLIGVSILLNVVTAFFVESFVTTLDMRSPETGGEGTATVHKERDFSIKTSENSNVRRITSHGSLTLIEGEEGDVEGSVNDADSEGSLSDGSDRFHFDVFEREGFDKIMQTVGGGALTQDDFARQVCDHLETFESLTAGRGKVGFLVCCQQTMNRYGNLRFQNEARGFVGKNALHVVVSDMHSELLALSARNTFDDRSLIRTFPHENDPNTLLEISASLLRRHPAMSLFVSTVIKGNEDVSHVNSQMR